MSSGWDNFGEKQKQTFWDSSLDIFDHTKFPGLDVEMRLITTMPFVYMTHWAYRDLIDAWLHANDRDALKAKYGGKLSGKQGPKKKSWECLDFDHDQRRSLRCNDPLCTTYSKYIEIPDPTSLFQAFWRVPSSPNEQLRGWQKAKVFRFNRGAAEKLGTVLRDQGKMIADPDKGYSIYTTYTANQGANTWSVRFGSRTALPPAMRAAIPKSLIDFSKLYQKPTVQEVDDWLNQVGYPKLLDPNFVPPGVGGGAQGGQGAQGGFGGAPGGYAPAGGRAPARQQGYQQPFQPGAGGYPAQQQFAPAAGGYATQDAGYDNFVQDEFAPGAPGEFQDPTGAFSGDFNPGEFADPGADGQGDFGTDNVGMGGGEFDEMPAMPDIPPAQPMRQAPPMRPAAPMAPRAPGQAMARPAAPPMAPRPGAAPPQRPQAPMLGQRPAAPPGGYQQPGARPAAPRPSAPPQPGRR